MIFSLLRLLRDRRRRRLSALPFPEDWRRHLVERVPFYLTLSSDERTRLESILRVIVVEKVWDGCGGLSIDDEIRVVVAAQAALLVLGIEHDFYHHVKSIVVYPSTVVIPDTRWEGGIQVRGESAVLGLAWRRGPVVLAWDAARHGAWNPEDGRNVVFHEFAHQLDMVDDFVDGTPPLETREQYEAWVRIMTREYEALCRETEREKAALLDAYGAEDPAEFFAVATEFFFERSKAVLRKHPDLYALLREYYRQDPAAREGASPSR